MPWIVTKDGDPRLLALADRHYSRKTVGARLAVQPGRRIVLVTADGRAAWVTSHTRYRRDGRTGWECSLFRNEGPFLSSHLIVLALGITRYLWGDPPPEGMFTFVGRHLRGGCFHAAGFRKDGTTQDGRLCLRLSADRFPPPIAPEMHTLFEDHGLAQGAVATPMRRATFRVEAVPPSLNVWSRTARLAAHRLKTEYGHWVAVAVHQASQRGDWDGKPFHRARCVLRYHFPDARRRDADNYSGKFLLDGLVAEGVLLDDDWAHLTLVLERGPTSRPGWVEVVVEEQEAESCLG